VNVIVCGGRDFSDWDLLRKTLDAMHAKKPFDRVAHGAAPGADALADSWARLRRIKIERYYALWKTHGKAAGPIRNQKMLEEERPDLVIAFSGGRGTADMVRRARAAGVKVMAVTGR
jgi:YspA, cpYpsA-related SLOG family